MRAVLIAAVCLLAFSAPGHAKIELALARDPSQPPTKAFHVDVTVP